MNKNNEAATPSAASAPTVQVGTDIPDRSEALASRLLSRLKFRDINLVSTVYELRSIRAAALRLNLSQAAATKRLQEVEDALGVALFVRQPTSLKPTGEGDVVYQACQHWRAAALALAGNLHRSQQGLGARIVLGVGHSFFVHETVRLLQLLAEKAPLLEIAVRLGSSSGIAQGLLDGSIDMGLGIALGPREEALVGHALPGVETVVVASPEHPLLQVWRTACDGPETVPLDVLSTQRWLTLPEGDPLRTALRQLFPDGLGQGLMEVGSLQALLACMQGLHCLTLLPAPYAKVIAEQGMVVVVPAPAVMRIESYRVVHHRLKPLCPAGQMLLQHLVPQAMGPNLPPMAVD